MKRVLLSILMFMGLALSVSAQQEEMHYFTDANGTGWTGRDFINRSAKTYRFDGDSEDECLMEIRNYKKNGNTETFDIYVKMGYHKGKKRGSITITTDPDLVVAKGKDIDLSKQKVVIKDDGYTYKYYFLTGKQVNKLEGKSEGISGGNPVDMAKEKGKALLNKGKDLFKKNKKDK